MMDRHDRLRACLEGTPCTVCGAALDPWRIRVLAEREDLAFVELPCHGCGSATLGMITASADGDPALDLAAAGELRPDEAARFSGRPPLDLDDVVDMHRFLAAYGGDLRGLLDGRAAGPGSGPEPAAGR
jgi:hypothetical protein